jgi:integrase
MSQSPLEPTAVYRPGTHPGSTGDSGVHQRAGSAITGTESPPGGGSGGEGLPVLRPGAQPVALGPLVATIGAIPGLRPRRTRRRRGDTTPSDGEVPGADVDLLDALAATEPQAWAAAASWLQSSPSISTRQTRLGVLAAFLRWLQHDHPGTGLLQATEHHLIAYRDAAATGALQVGVRTVGEPLGAATVVKRLTNLSSFYTTARRRNAAGDNPAAFVEYPAVSTEGSTGALSPDEQLALRRGVEILAATEPVQACAVALLATLGIRVGSLIGLTVGDVRQVNDPGGEEHTVVVFRRKGGKTSQLPVPGRVQALLDPLRADRTAREPLFTTAAGHPVDRWWASAALTRAARAGGIPPARARTLHPHMTRATFITRLLWEETPLDQVQAAVQHASPATTARYKERAQGLAGHPVYRLEDTYTTTDPP